MFRETTEVILVHQALRLGGVRAPITIEPLNATGPQRFLQKLANGQATIMGESLWLSDIERAGNQVTASSSIIADGRFLVGIYTHPNNQKALQTKSLQDLKQLRFVSNRNWANDWRTLESLEVKTLYSANYFKSMLHMVRAGRADALLSAFPSTHTLIREHEGNGLIPIANIRIALRGSRHFAVSMSHSNSQRLFAALERGLTQLRQQGKIEQAYQESGFYHPATQNWPILNNAHSQ